MEKFNAKICYGGGYIIPTLRVCALNQVRTLCASNGTTQNYGSGSIWDEGDDNE